MNDLTKRSFTGAAYVAVMLGGIVIHPFVFAVVYVVILFFTQSEFYKIYENAGYKPHKVFGLISGVSLFALFFLVASHVIPYIFILFAVPFIFFVFIAELLRTNNNAIKNSSLTLFGLVYVALPFSLLNFIVFVPKMLGSSTYYPWILAGIFFIIWSYDSMAYLSGSMLGKHKIASKISPKKSWEGLIGGAVFAVIVSLVCAVLFQEISMFEWVVISFIIVIFGTLGDFFESKLKREIGLKDSSDLLPGHGGLLDRFDSLLFSVPVIFIWLNLIDKF